MWWFIGGALVIIILLLWGLMAGTREEDNYEDQMQAIKDWENKRNNKKN